MQSFFYKRDDAVFFVMILSRKSAIFVYTSADKRINLFLVAGRML